MAQEKILVVEDEKEIAHLIQLYLRKSGYTVTALAESGEDALRAADRLLPDLVLMDIELAGALDGVETAELLHHRFDVPVVFLTGLSDDTTLQRSRSADAFGYLLKPFRPEQLAAAIETALDKHKAERELRQIENWFSATLKSIGDGVIATDRAGGITFLNPVAEDLTGWKLEETPGKNLRDIFLVLYPADHPAADNSITRALREDRTVAFPRPALLRSRAGREIPIEASAAPIKNSQGQVIGAVLIVRDISERQRAEAELSQSREQLRSLAAHLQSVREEERTHIAREIHDELGQMLTGFKMDVAWLEKRLALVPDPVARPAFLDKVKTMSGLIDDMVKSVRRISAELRPGVLDDLGLVAALEWQAREFQSRTGIQCRFDSAPGDVALGRDLCTALFRICQETLTNAARHAQAANIFIQLTGDERLITLTVRDDGRGITAEDMARAKSFGLVGMRERAAILGGEFKISGVPGEGTTVAVTVPALKPGAS